MKVVKTPYRVSGFDREGKQHTLIVKPSLPKNGVSVGGIYTKIEAAYIATRAGIPVFLSNLNTRGKR